jgi:hydrogenase expression/formation protein HypD
MKFLFEYRSHKLAGKLQKALAEATKGQWTIMEICGGQTHSIMRFGLEDLLPENINLLHGPGCPICVTPLAKIDLALKLAKSSEVIFTSFGDMLRIPGSEQDLLEIKAEGADVRFVYSPLDCLNIARDNPHKQVIFFAVGFETTAPAHALAVKQAKYLGLKNFSLLNSHVLVPPVISSLLENDAVKIDAFLGPGHVCSVVGYKDYVSLSKKYNLPIVISGFEPVDILEAMLMAVRQLESGSAIAENQYVRAVSLEGNIQAQKLVAEVFEVVDQDWRGIGTIAQSGLSLRKAYSEFDCEKRFAIDLPRSRENSICISGQILQGIKKPNNCPAFAQSCTPEHPLGATMVSAEGACAAYYRYRQREANTHDN